VLNQETTMFFRQRAAADATLSYFFGCAAQQKAVGFKNRFNPVLSMTKQAFVEALTSGNSPHPAEMDRIIAADLRGLVPAHS
jgi:hypothetical protein